MAKKTKLRAELAAAFKEERRQLASVQKEVLDAGTREGSLKILLDRVIIPHVARTVREWWNLATEGDKLGEKIASQGTPTEMELLVFSDLERLISRIKPRFCALRDLVQYARQEMDNTTDPDLAQLPGLMKAWAEAHTIFTYEHIWSAFGLDDRYAIAIGKERIENIASVRKRRWEDASSWQADAGREISQKLSRATDMGWAELTDAVGAVVGRTGRTVRKHFPNPTPRKKSRSR